MTFVESFRRLCVALAILALGVMVSEGVGRPFSGSIAAAQESAKTILLAVNPEQSKVHWALESTLHTVHGTFAVRSGSVTIDSATGRATGEIVVDAASGQSGNDGRDKKMHKEIIESAKYKEIVFRPDHFDGAMPSQGAVSGQLHGIFSLHGADHELTLPIQADFTPEHWRGTAKFTVPYIAWGLKSPSNFFLKADPTVTVELELTGTLTSPSEK
jgi:polyisoprenoid-binding protein YceI